MGGFKAQGMGDMHSECTELCFVDNKGGYNDGNINDYINKYGDNLYTLIDGGQVVASDALVKQGCLEASNVNVVDEMVDMIEIARAYEAGQKMIQAEDSTLEKTANQIGKV